jgi:hypothetical protein
VAKASGVDETVRRVARLREGPPSTDPRKQVKQPACEAF